jgi:hypothetical protein
MLRMPTSSIIKQNGLMNEINDLSGEFTDDFLHVKPDVTDEEFAEIKAALHEQLDLLQPVGLALVPERSGAGSEARSTKRGGRK